MSFSPPKRKVIPKKKPAFVNKSQFNRIYNDTTSQWNNNTNNKLKSNANHVKRNKRKHGSRKSDEKSDILDDITLNIGSNDYWRKIIFVSNDLFMIQCKKCGKIPKIPFENTDGDCLCWGCRRNSQSTRKSKIYNRCS